MIDIKSGDGEIKLVAVVRDKNGNPKFDDYNNIPEIFNRVLSEKDWTFINEKRGNS